MTDQTRKAIEGAVDALEASRPLVPKFVRSDGQSICLHDGCADNLHPGDTIESPGHHVDCAAMKIESSVAALTALLESGGWESERWFLSQDSSCHWYVVPYLKGKEWSEWNSLDDEDERSWIAPEFARRIGGSPAMILFLDPRTVVELSQPLPAGPKSEGV